MKLHELRVYEDKAYRWRWRLKAPNGRIIADSGEGYSRRANAVRAADRIVDLLKVSVLRIG